MSTGPATAASQTDAQEGDPPGAGGAMSIGSVSSVVLANNRKRRRNVSVEVDKAGEHDSSDDEDDGDDALLDWRAKTF